MSSIDPVRLSKTMAFLLRHRPEVGNLTLDEEGWVDLDALSEAVSGLLRADVQSVRVVAMVLESRTVRFEIHETRIRAVTDKRNRRRTGANRITPPDILYHAGSAELMRSLDGARLLHPGEGRQVYLSSDDTQAWRVAHRNFQDPRVLYVDATRARRHGVRFYRNRRTGLFQSTPIPTQDILNLRRGFAEQHSAGGFPMHLGDDGRIRVALIRVTRRSGVTWEVAKGKLEPGETPEMCAAREVQEEMGIDVNLRVVKTLSSVRYGFLAPGGLPRLKTIFLYLLESDDTIGEFTPATSEGIGAVGWFTADEAVEAVTHTSLRPVMGALRTLIHELEIAAAS